MSLLGVLVAGLFLPLFPLSMVFNQVFARVGDPRLRMGLLLLWPQLGILVLMALGERPPAGVVWWAAGTAALYALRAVALRDLALWTGFMATSAWSLLWLAVAVASPTPDAGALAIQGLGLSLPLILLAWLTGLLEATVGAARAGVCGGLAMSAPRLSALLTLGVLAAVATPPVPGFFTLLSISIGALPVMPGVALLTLAVWLLWAWGGARILGGFIPGSASAAPTCDLEANVFGWLGLALMVLVLAGVGISGELI